MTVSCAVSGCDSPRRTRDWCARHYQAWRRHGDPTVAAYTWAPAGHVCVVCRATTLRPGSRRFCSDRCQQIDWRARQGKRSNTEALCEGCGAPFSTAARPGERKQRVDTRYCQICRRLRSLRVVGSGRLTISQARALGAVCAICGRGVDLVVRAPDPDAPSIDHKVPPMFGGTEEPSNFQMTHWGCNQRKHLRLDDGDFGREERQRFYSLRRWRRLAALVRIDEPSCRLCAAPSVCVDHIVGIEEGGDRWDRRNLQALCLRCHLLKSQREYRDRWAS